MLLYTCHSTWILITNTHAVGFFYFLLGNLSPKYRSALRAINLVAVVKKKLIKDYSMNAVLTPIVDDIKKLVSQDPFGGMNINLPLNLNILGGWSHVCY